MSHLVYQVVITYGDKVALAVLSLLGLLCARLVHALFKSKLAQDTFARVGSEVRAVVLEVEQTYVASLRDASADGTLTEDEKAKAKVLAMQKLKSYLGTAGLRRLASAIGAGGGLLGWLGAVAGKFDVGAVEKWLEGKVESHVAAAKQSAQPIKVVAQPAAKEPPPLPPA